MDRTGLPPSVRSSRGKVQVWPFSMSFRDAFTIRWYQSASWHEPVPATSASKAGPSHVQKSGSARVVLL
jgi:hypothetical protein